MTLALALDKPMTKRVLSYHGLPTPPFQVFERIDEPLDPELIFPLFAKPSREGTGMGVSAESIVQNEAELRVQLQRIFDRYNQPALVEHYIEGREITVGMVGNLSAPVARRLPEDEDAPRIVGGLHFFPPLEVDLKAYPAEEAGLYTNRIKVELVHDFYCLCPAPLSPEQVEDLNWLAAATFRVMGCRDVGRVDFRLDANDNNKPYILEINPLPGLNPEYSDLCLEATAAGWSYDQLINAILDEAIERYDLPHNPDPVPKVWSPAFA
jgi:D-alanine-D-alanine ligase